MIRKGSVILSAAKPKPEISKDKKLKRAGTTGLPDSCSFLMETVGVEDGSQAETRSLCGLRDFISVGEHLGEHFSSLFKF